MPVDTVLFDRRLLSRRRARAAEGAAQHDFLLRRVTDDLVDRLSFIRRRFAKALVLGSHHGLLGCRLRGDLGIETVIEADLCPALVRQCRPPALVADEEWLPFSNQSLDLVVAPLTLQTVNDLPGVFAQVHRALKPDGLFIAALAGGATLVELRQALIEAESETSAGVSPRIHPAVDGRAVGQLLQRTGFALPVVDADLVTVTYPNPLALMHDLRGMGATNVLSERSRTPLRRDTLMRACRIYAERYGNADGRIRASFEIIVLTAWTPHESQQQPLKPGSATMRLAQALLPAGRADGSAKP